MLIWKLSQLNCLWGKQASALCFTIQISEAAAPLNNVVDSYLLWPISLSHYVSKLALDRSRVGTLLSFPTWSHLILFFNFTLILLSLLPLLFFITLTCCLLASVVLHGQEVCILTFCVLLAQPDSSGKRQTKERWVNTIIFNHFPHGAAWSVYQTD